MLYDQPQLIPIEERTYASRFDSVTHWLDALVHRPHGDDSDSIAVNLLLDDAIKLRQEAEARKQDDVDEALRLLDQAIEALTAAEERAHMERRATETSGLHEYAVLLLVVSEWSERVGSCVYTQAGYAHVEQTRALIEIAIGARQKGEIDQAVQHLHSAVASLWQGIIVEDTFRPKFEQLGQWYRVVARGVEPGSEAHEWLEQFVVAVDAFNDAITRDDTDHMIETFDTAIALLKAAALARPRR